MSSGDAPRSQDEALVRVVVVEDDPSMRALYQAILAYDRDVEIIGASTINEAFRVPWSRVDIAIIDLRLPDGSGSRVSQMLMDHHPHVRRVVATAMPLVSLKQADLVGAEIAVTKGTAWESVVRGLILDLAGRRNTRSEPRNKDKEKESWLSRMLR